MTASPALASPGDAHYARGSSDMFWFMHVSDLHTSCEWNATDEDANMSFAFGPALSAIVMSQSLLPTVLPGIVTLGIGNQQTQLLMAPGSFLHDPTTGIARFDFGPIPPWFSGFVMHMQAVTIDLTTPTLPLPTTNIWDVTF